MVRAEIVTRLEDLEALHDAWDALAVANGLPMAAPSLLKAWWRHVDSATTELRVVVARDGDELVGVGPWSVGPAARLGRRDYRLIGSGLLLRIAPLAAPGHAWEVAEAMAAALADAQPAPSLVTLEGEPLTSPWREVLRERWPSAVRPRAFSTSVQGAPTVSLAAPDLDTWLAGKSSNFRSQMRRMRRRLADEGGVARLSTPETLRADAEAFLRLHSGRWEDRGTSSLTEIGTPVVDMLEEAGRVAPDGRFRLWILEIGGRPISAQLFLAAGGEIVYWNGGWDEDYAHLRPPQLAILLAIEHALACGDRRLDLGGGEQPYKLRFADGDDPLGWGGIVVPGLRAPAARASLAPQLARDAARSALKRGLAPERAEQVRAVYRRVSGLRGGG